MTLASSPINGERWKPTLPARTLLAHLGKDSYSHIHYDSKQARTISVREAARFQSFPDGFVFSGTMNTCLQADRQRRPSIARKGRCGLRADSNKSDFCPAASRHRLVNVECPIPKS